jgi:hypothetical protein
VFTEHVPGQTPKFAVHSKNIWPFDRTRKLKSLSKDSAKSRPARLLRRFVSCEVAQQLPVPVVRQLICVEEVLWNLVCALRSNIYKAMPTVQSAAEKSYIVVHSQHTDLFQRCDSGRA